MFRQVFFGAENQGNHQNLEKSLLSYKCGLIFVGMKEKNFFWKNEIKNGWLKKSSFFKIDNSQYFFVKISWMGPWVSRIDWREGHWCGLTYMVVRSSNISFKTGKKLNFCVFRPFLSLCQTASRLHI